MAIKLWVDDVRPAPEGYIHAHSVNEAIEAIEAAGREIALVDIDHDAGDFAHDGGDFINLLDWLAAEGLNFPVRIHSMNPVGRDNMLRTIRRNGWPDAQ